MLCVIMNPVPFLLVPGCLCARVFLLKRESQQQCATVNLASEMDGM